MKNTICTLIAVLFFQLCSFAQINFEAGYFIDNDGKRTECLIKNKQWRSNPIDFKYKLSEEGVEKVGMISKIKEFGINNYSRYVKAKVAIDMSTDQTEKLDYNKEPVWETHVVFLNTLVLGKAELFKYIEGVDLVRYFYRVDNGEIKQLVYKRYIVDSKSTYGTPGNIDTKKYKFKGIMENESFKKQLWEDVRCGSKSLKLIQRLRYNQSSFVKYFKEYNSCFK